jgi:ferredoxin
MVGTKRGEKGAGDAEGVEAKDGKKPPPKPRVSRAIELAVLFLVGLSILLVFAALFTTPLFQDVSKGIHVPRYLVISIPLAATAFVLVLAGAYAKIPMRIRTVRYSVQGLVLYAINATALGSLYVAPFLPTLRFRHMAAGEVGGVPLCSVGSVARCLSENWAVSGPVLSVIMMFIALVVVLLFVGLIIGRAMCAWVCPIGLMQDLATRVRSGLKIGPKEPSQRAHDLLSLVRFALLAFFILLALSIGVALLLNHEAGVLYQNQYGDLPLLQSGATPCEFCPAPITAYFMPSSINSAIAGQFAWSVENSARLFVFMSVWVGAFLTPQFFCRYFCWSGAIISPANKVSTLTLYKDQKKCTKCNYCANACPMRVQELRDESIDCRIDNLNCTYCLECIDHCPEKALDARVGGKVLYRGGKDWWER